MGTRLVIGGPITENISDALSDHGTDILGSSDSILGGCDTYSLTEQRLFPRRLTTTETRARPIIWTGPPRTTFILTTPAAAP